MLWDGLMVALVLTLAVAGWNVGIVNSWRGPFAIVLATVVTQIFYVDFATWIVQQLRMPPDQAIATGYVLMWCGTEIVCELLLSVIVPFNKKTRPMLLERISGALLGAAKGLVIILLPFLALQAPIKVPHPPADKSALVNPLDLGIEKSSLIPVFTGIAKNAMPAIGSFVVSTKEPSFKPSFSGTTAVDENNSK